MSLVFEARLEGAGLRKLSGLVAKGFYSGYRMGNCRFQEIPKTPKREGFDLRLIIHTLHLEKGCTIYLLMVETRREKLGGFTAFTYIYFTSAGSEEHRRRFCFSFGLAVMEAGVYLQCLEAAVGRCVCVCVCLST